MIALFEPISYKKIKHLHIFLADIGYRDYHEHNDYEVFAVIRGSARVRMSTAEFYVSAGSFTVINPRAAHEIDAEGGKTTAVVIQFSPYFCREYYPHARRLMVENPDMSGIDRETVVEIMAHICRMAIHYFGDDRLFELRCVEDLAHLMILIAERLPCQYLNPGQHHSRITKDRKIDIITSYLDSKYQYPVRLEDVAKLVDMTPAYLSHFFTKTMGVNFHDYLSKLRFEHALRQIDRDLPLGDIARGSGFSDLKYMTRAFLKNTGLTPAEYRKKHHELQTRRRLKSIREPNQHIYSEQQSKKLLLHYLESLV